MGLVVLTCHACEGTGLKNEHRVCPVCDGSRGILAHTGSIGLKLPYPNQLELFKPSETLSRENHFYHDGPVFQPTPSNPSPHMFTCTSGLGDKCSCYACHGG